MLDDDEAVAAIHEGLENGEQAGNVVAVKAGGGLVEEEKRSCWSLKFEICDLRYRCARRIGVSGEVFDEFKALGFAAAEGI